MLLNASARIYTPFFAHAREHSSAECGIDVQKKKHIMKARVLAAVYVEVAHSHTQLLSVVS